MSAPSNFNADLNLSNSPEAVAGITAACFEYLPDLLEVRQAHKELDKLGADYVLTFQRGRFETVDVKIRRVDYWTPDEMRNCCIELLANIQTNKPGWTIDSDKINHWVCFYYLDTKKAYFYDARLLRKTVIKHLPELRKHGKKWIQRTGGYESESLFVDHKELGKYIYLDSHVNTNRTLAA